MRALAPEKYGSIGIRTVHLRHIKPRPLLSLRGFFYAFVEKQFVRPRCIGAGGRDQPVAGGDRVQDGRHDRHRQPELPRRDGLSARRNHGQASPDVRDAGAARQPDYHAFWAQLNRGEYPGRRIQARRQGRPRGLDSGVLQSDPRQRRQAGQGRQVRHRHHRAQDPQHGGCRQDRGDRPGAGRDRVQSRRHHHHGQR